MTLTIEFIFTEGLSHFYKVTQPVCRSTWVLNLGYLYSITKVPKDTYIKSMYDATKKKKKNP